jgi:uncharacterized protein YdhG (YjbR/CyaY superfamily)
MTYCICGLPKEEPDAPDLDELRAALDDVRERLTNVAREAVEDIRVLDELPALREQEAELITAICTRAFSGPPGT